MTFGLRLSSISVILGQFEDDNKMMCSTKPHLRLKIFPFLGIELGAARSAEQRLTHCTDLPGHHISKHLSYAPGVPLTKIQCKWTCLKGSPVLSSKSLSFFRVVP